MGNRTSEHLLPGAIYSRKDLRKQFYIEDATLNNGVYRPSGFKSIWLFITENKPADRTPYDDSLLRDELRWDGQLAGRTDHLIVDHAAEGNELLVFYRRWKDEHPGFGFRFEGRFEYVSHKPGIPVQRKPSNFILRRCR